MKEKNKEQYEMDFASSKASIKEMKHEAPAPDFSNLIMADDKKEIEERKLVTSTHNFVVIDIETTGLEPLNERITEIVALRYNSGWNFLKAVYHNLLNPQRRIPMHLQELTKITTDMVKYKPYASQGVKDLVKGLNMSSDILVAHNAAFELKWLKHSESIFEMYNWICTRGIYLYMRDGNTWDGNFKKNYSRLKQVCEYYGIEYVETDAHRAEYDVLKTKLVAEKMIKEIGLNLCLKISYEYARGRGYGRRKTKDTAIQLERNIGKVKSQEEVKSRCAGAPLGPKGIDGSLYD